VFSETTAYRWQRFGAIEKLAVYQQSSTPSKSTVFPVSFERPVKQGYY
jgi:hypothetical protein